MGYGVGVYDDEVLTWGNHSNKQYDMDSCEIILLPPLHSHTTGIHTQETQQDWVSIKRVERTKCKSIYIYKQRTV